jgi:hypothetical protein
MQFTRSKDVFKKPDCVHFVPFWMELAIKFETSQKWNVGFDCNSVVCLLYTQAGNSYAALPCHLVETLVMKVSTVYKQLSTNHSLELYLLQLTIQFRFPATYVTRNLQFGS